MKHLSSWNKNGVEGGSGAQARIVEFIEKATDPGSPSFVPPTDRVAVFDNDGTLCSERPHYIQLQFTMEKIRAMAPSHPEWKTEQPFRAILEGDEEYLKTLRESDAAKVVAAAYAGMSEQEFEKELTRWFSSQSVPFSSLIYSPMIELLHYVQRQGFRTYLVTGGGIDFVRSISQDCYGIPPEQVIGSAIVLEFVPADHNNGQHKPDFKRVPKIAEPINDGPGKPVNIQREIGKPPIIAVGNSDGDLEMLQFADASPYPTLKILIHHDDSKREHAYDLGAEKVLKEAHLRNWVIVSMSRDFKKIFSHSAAA